MDTKEERNEAPSILHLSLRDLLDSEFMARIEDDIEHDYYVSDDWSQNFYIVQAIRGFIAVGYTTKSGVDLLLPQMQQSYCILTFIRSTRGKRL